MSKLATVFRRHPLISTVFALGLVVTLGLAVRTTVFALYWADPAHRDAPIEGWMTPGYVAHSWHLPHDAMAEALALEPGSGRPRTLDEIAAARGVPLEALIAQIEEAVRDYRDGDGG